MSSRREDSLLLWDRKDPALWFALYRDEAPDIGVPWTLRLSHLLTVVLAVILSPLTVTLFHYFGPVIPTALAVAIATVASFYHLRDTPLIFITAFAFRSQIERRNLDPALPPSSGLRYRGTSLNQSRSSDSVTGRRRLHAADT